MTIFTDEQEYSHLRPALPRGQVTVGDVRELMKTEAGFFIPADWGQ